MPWNRAPVRDVMETPYERSRLIMQGVAAPIQNGAHARGHEPRPTGERVVIDGCWTLLFILLGIIVLVLAIISIRNH